ncbi:precorrin-4 C(11)-methyltransferase [Pelobacter seleniigenes]|uniref:precorrin-4 C(11)-methyltransferase n=1 Tax=Pelobacter seleniigenes TaxID=407188 RepID=UPI0004A721B4|nr:precorrin-4 C(11)-methyltransferase [Pelobacter seleniigenes]
MKVFFVGAGPGNPELLTVRAHRLLSHCEICIYAGSLVSPEVVALAPAGADLYDSAEMTLEEMEVVFRQAQLRGVDLIRLHTGDPAIYGAIREQMNSLDRLGIDYEVIPGISSFQAAAATLKTELTAPEVSQTIILSRTSGRTPMPEQEELEQLAKTRSTLCLFLSVHKIGEVAGELAPWYGADCPAAVVFHASWPDEKVVRGTLADIALKVEQEQIRKTAMIIVGQALARDIPVSRLYHRSFSHGYRRGDER